MPKLGILPVFKIAVTGVSESDTALRRFGSTVEDWRGFWAQLGESLATETQRRWPLKRLSGRLRESLSWAGSRLGKRGIYESSPDRLRFGTAIFYSRFSQVGTKRQRARALIHINEKQHAAQLTTWLQARAVASGLEIT